MADFTVAEGGILVGYSGSGGAVSVPSTVSKIGRGAFSNMPVTAVTLPSATTEIRKGAFSGCSQLSSITIPSAQVYIAADAFTGTQVLGAPTNLRVVGSQIQWNAPANAPRGISSYNVYINGQQQTSATSSISSSSLVKGSTNTIQVAAVDSAGEGVRSPILTFASSGQNGWIAGTPFGGTTDWITVFGNSLYARKGETGEINRYTIEGTATGGFTTTTGHTGQSISISENFNQFVVSESDAIKIYNPADNMSVVSITGNAGQANAAVAVSADGKTLVIGCSDGDGCVYIYQYYNSQWMLMKSLSGTPGAAEGFGAVVAVSENGQTIAVGAKYALGTGAVRIYSGRLWTQQSNLYGESASNENFGHSLALSRDGKTLIVGSPCMGTTNLPGAANAGDGAATIWKLQSGVWTKKKTFYGAPDEQLGSNVSINALGTTVAIVGAGSYGSVHICAQNETDSAWPEAILLTGSASQTFRVAALNVLGDAVYCGGSVITVVHYRTDLLKSSPSLTSLLYAASVNDATSAEAAAQKFADDVDTLVMYNSIKFIDEGINRFAAALPGGGSSTSMSALLMAGNMLDESQNYQKALLQNACVSVVGVTPDTYINIPTACIAKLISSTGSENHQDNYSPTQLYAYFPASSSISVNGTYTHVSYALTPGDTYTFGTTSLTYRRKSALQQLLLSLPGADDYRSPFVALFSASAINWRRETIYSVPTGNSAATLLECATVWKEKSLSNPEVNANYITLAWLSTDMLLSSDETTRIVGAMLARRNIPIVRGILRINAFCDGGVDAEMDWIPSEYFKGAADGSVSFPSTLTLTHSAPLKRIDANVFDSVINTVSINGQSFAVSNGNIALSYGATRIWSINVGNGIDILLPGAPSYTPANGRIDIPTSIAYIPDNYFANATASTVNFSLCKSTDVQIIGKNAFPSGSRIRVNNSNNNISLIYNFQFGLTRYSGIFYKNFETIPEVVWAMGAPLNTDNTHLLPAKANLAPNDSQFTSITKLNATVVIPQDTTSDRFLWNNKNAKLSIRNNTVKYGNLSYSPMAENLFISPALHLNPSPVQSGTAAVIKPLQLFYRSYKSAQPTFGVLERYESEIPFASIPSFAKNDKNAIVSIPHSTDYITCFINVYRDNRYPPEYNITSWIGGWALNSGLLPTGQQGVYYDHPVHYTFTRNDLSDGQVFHYGNLAWINSTSASGLRIKDILSTADTAGKVYLMPNAFSLYAYMFGTAAPTIREIRSYRPTTTYTGAFGSSVTFQGVKLNASIPAFTFKGCENLQSHDFAFQSSIGESAFEGCRSLASGTINLTDASFTIGKNAFKGCSAFPSVALSSTGGVSLSTGAFADCSGAASISVDCSGAVSIASSAFAGCTAATSVSLKSKTSITLSANAFSDLTGITSLIIDCSGAVSIAANAFSGCTALSSITLKSGTTLSIAADAFNGCSSAVAVSITAGGATTVAANAFRNFTGLTGLTVQSTGALSIAANAFSGCSSLATVAITGKSSVDIGEDALRSLTGLQSITVDCSGAASCGANSFNGNTALESITLKGSSTTITATAFTGCTGVKTILVSALVSSTPFPFTTMTGLQTVQISTASGPLTVGSFAGCTALTSVVVSGSSSVYFTGNQFTGCTGLQTVSITNPIAAVVAADLSGCTALQTLSLVSPATSSGTCVLPPFANQTSLTTVQITLSGALTLPETFCNGCTALNSVQIAATRIETPANGNMFSGCSALETLSVSATANPTANIFSIASTLSGLKDLTISGTVPVGGSPFWTNSVLRNLDIRGTRSGTLGTLPAATIQTINVVHDVSQSITAYQYKNYTALKSVSITPLVDISEGAFFGCTNMTSFNFDQTKSIDDWAFANTGLSGEVVIPATTTYFGDAYLVGCPNLKKISYRCNLTMFTDPTRLLASHWENILFRRTGATPVDICGSAIITRDLSSNMTFSYTASGSTTTIPSSSLQKTINWTKFVSRYTNLDLMAKEVSKYYTNDTSGNYLFDTSGAFLIDAAGKVLLDASGNPRRNTTSPYWREERHSGLISRMTGKLREVGEKCEDTLDVIPSFSGIEGWDGTRFVSLDSDMASGFLPANMYINFRNKFLGANGSPSAIATYYKNAIQANENILTNIPGDQMVVVPSNYTIPSSLFRMSLNHGEITDISAPMRTELINGNIYYIWDSPRIIFRDMTILKITGQLSIASSELVSTNLAQVIKWSFENSKTLSSESQVAISINNKFTSIKFLDHKESTVVDISSTVLTIYDYGMTTFNNTILNINCLAMTICNNAFNYWGGNSVFTLNSLYTPNVGVDIFAASQNITINSNKFLINQPSLTLVDYDNITLDDVPQIIEQYTDVSANMTTNVKIGTYVPASTDAFTTPFTYIKFQALPSLKLYILLQKPKDWFWAKHTKNYNYAGQVIFDGLTKLTDESNYGLTSSYAPDEFTFFGIKFTRTTSRGPRDGSVDISGSKVNVPISTEGHTADAAAEEANKLQKILISISIMVAIQLVVGIATAGLGSVLAYGVQVAAITARTAQIITATAAITAEIAGSFLATASSNAATTGSFDLGDIREPSLWIDLALGVVFAGFGGAIFSKMKDFVKYVRGFATKTRTYLKSSKPVYKSTTLRRTWPKKEEAPLVELPPPPKVQDEIFENIEVQKYIEKVNAGTIVGGTQIRDITSIMDLYQVGQDVVQNAIEVATTYVRKEFSFLKKAETSTVSQFKISKVRGHLQTIHTKPSTVNTVETMHSLQSAKRSTGELLNLTEPSTIQNIAKQMHISEAATEIGTPALYAEKIGGSFSKTGTAPAKAGNSLTGSTRKLLSDAKGDAFDFGEPLVKSSQSALTKNRDEIGEQAVSFAAVAISRDAANDAYEFFMDALLSDLYIKIYMDNYDSSATTAKEVVSKLTGAKTHLNLPTTQSMTLSQLASYSSQMMLPSISALNAIGSQVINETSYLNSYFTNADSAVPPFIFSTPMPPKKSTNKNEPTYMFYNYVTSGTNYNHSNISRGANGNPCAVPMTAGPLMLNSNYMWSGTQMVSSPTGTYMTNITNPTSKNDFNGNGGVILTLGEKLDTELYMIERNVSYTSTLIECPNMVYNGAFNITVIIPDSITTIPDYAFNGTDGKFGTHRLTITAAYLHPGITSIGKQAFYRSQMEMLAYPSAATIGERAFANTNLNRVIALSPNSSVLSYVGENNVEVEFTPSLSMKFIGTKSGMFVINYGSAQLKKNGAILQTITSGQGKWLFLQGASELNLKNLNSDADFTINPSEVISYWLGSAMATFETPYNYQDFDTSANIWITTRNKEHVLNPSAYNLPLTPDGTTYFAQLKKVLYNDSYYKDPATGSNIYYQKLEPTLRWASDYNVSNPSFSVKGCEFVKAGTGSAVITVDTARAADAPETSIADHAFEGSAQLEHIDFPDNCVRIGANAFKGCTSLKKPICLPATIRTIGANAFADSGVPSVVIPAGITEIGANAFPADCSIVLLADEMGKVSSAAASLGDYLGPKNTVFVPSIAVLEELLPTLGGIPMRVDRAPLQPIGVSAKPLPNAVALSWSAIPSVVSSPATSYTVLSVSNSGETTTHADVSSPFILENLNAGEEYTISIVAKNSVGNSTPTAIQATPTA